MRPLLVATRLLCLLAAGCRNALPWRVNLDPALPPATARSALEAIGEWESATRGVFADEVTRDAACEQAPQVACVRSGACAAGEIACTHGGGGAVVLLPAELEDLGEAERDSVLAHELGHVLGLSHTAAGVMALGVASRPSPVTCGDVAQYERALGWPNDTGCSYELLDCSGAGDDTCGGP